MALNSLFCADVPLSNYSHTPISYDILDIFCAVFVPHRFCRSKWTERFSVAGPDGKLMWLVFLPFVD